MAIPWSIHETSPQDLALLVIADLPHADPSIPGAFIEDASDPPKAAQYFLDTVLSGILAEWKTLVHKFRPTLAISLFNETKKPIFERDGGRRCLTRTPFKSRLDAGLEYVYVISPRVFTDPDLSAGTPFFEMLSNSLPEDLLKAACKPSDAEQERLDNLFLLSTQAFHAFKTGEMYLAAQRWRNKSDITPTQSIYDVGINVFYPEHRVYLSLLLDEVHIENRTPLLTPRMQTNEYMDASLDDSRNASPYYCRRLISRLLLISSILRRLWVGLPCFFRASVYDVLLSINRRIYGLLLSMNSNNSPPPAGIPAPRAIDVLEASRSAYLLLMCVTGHPIGHILDSMSDEQVEQAVKFRTCNSQGGGILEWSLSDSQCEELRFKKVRKRVATAHDFHHESFLTPGDLNPRNILVENGKSTDIVGWEDAGWFPEYWEYTKAHYSVRSVRRWLADVVDRVFDGYRNELMVENMLSDLPSPF
ncbi:hypothetical protein BJX96DRAFT_182634 [Aspergillus floccosus]